MPTISQVKPTGNRVFDISITDKTMARHGSNPSDGWDHQYFNEQFHGVLDVVPRRCYATLSQEGWYRILRFDATNSFDVLGADGAIIDFYITRQYNYSDNEVHKITLLRTYNKNVFVGEESLTNTFGISRIRLTLHDGGDDDRQAFVDIYNETSSENPVSVYFNVYTHRSYADKWNAVNFTSVGPSPYGETVVTEYEFVANTDSMIAFTPTAGIAEAGERFIYTLA